MAIQWLSSVPYKLLTVCYVYLLTRQLKTLSSRVQFVLCYILNFTFYISIINIMSCSNSLNFIKLKQLNKNFPPVSKKPGGGAGQLPQGSGLRGGRHSCYTPVCMGANLRLSSTVQLIVASTLSARTTWLERNSPGQAFVGLCDIQCMQADRKTNEPLFSFLGFLVSMQKFL